MSVLATYPISTNIPSTSKFDSDLILESERVRDSTFELPLIAFTIELEMKEILLLLLSLFCNNKSIDSSEPTGLSVLCIMYSREASSLRYNAASKAGSPAPTIATFLFLFTFHIQVSWSLAKCKNQCVARIFSIFVICFYYKATIITFLMFCYGEYLFICKFSSKISCLLFKLLHKFKTTYVFERRIVFYGICKKCLSSNIFCNH